jgi:hypothetical protein
MMKTEFFLIKLFLQSKDIRFFWYLTRKCGGVPWEEAVKEWEI